MTRAVCLTLAYPNESNKKKTSASDKHTEPTNGLTSGDCYFGCETGTLLPRVPSSCEVTIISEVFFFWHRPLCFSGNTFLSQDRKMAKPTHCPFTSSLGKMSSRLSNSDFHGVSNIKFRACLSINISSWGDLPESDEWIFYSLWSQPWDESEA